MKKSLAPDKIRLLDLSDVNNENYGTELDNRHPLKAAVSINFDGGEIGQSNRQISVTATAPLAKTSGKYKPSFPSSSSSSSSSSLHDPYSNVTKIKILTWNIGLLEYNICGCIPVFSNPPYMQERLPFIPEAIRKIGADVVALQECYSLKDAKFIASKLEDLYPYYSRHGTGTCLKFSNGLLIMSRWPITSSYLDKFKRVSTMENWLATKSILTCCLKVPNAGDISFVNIHTTAGGESCDPEHPDADMDRENELEQAIECVKHAALQGGEGVIVGDFNCGPESSRTNFEFLLNQGFRDTFLEAVAIDALKSPLLTHTWDPDNMLNQVGPHANTPKQRIDHVMMPNNEFWQNWKTQSAEVVFTEEVVYINASVRSTISDHFGLVIELAK